jgi:hypothetical protein
MMPNTTDNADLAARIAQLPRDVQAGVLTLEPEQQIAYLQSLDKMADLEARGETFTPDMSAPYGLKSDGTPKAKPGRKAAANPGQRTAARPDPVIRDMPDLDALLAGVDDDEPVIYGRDPGSPASPPPPPPIEAREDAERAEREAQLKAMLAAQGVAGVTATGREIVSEEFIGQKRIDPEDPDDPLAVPTIETIKYRVTADNKQWFLEEFVNDRWQDTFSAVDVTGLSFHFAFRQIVAPGLSDAIRGLPRHRPARQRYLDSLQTKGSDYMVKLTPEQRRERQKEIEASLQRQREGNRVRSAGRGSSEGPQVGDNFIWT